MARVVLTQPSPRVHALAGRLRERGHEALELPLTRVVENVDDPAVAAALARLDEFDWVILVSPAAVRAAARVPAVHWPASTGVAVIGPGSLQAIVEAGLPVDRSRVLHPDEPPFDADALTATPPLSEPAGLRILVLRGATGSDGWIERLRERGAIVRTCALYRHEARAPDDDALEALRGWLGAAAKPVFVVTQASSVARLESALAIGAIAAQAHRAPVLAIHPRIVEALERAGWADARLVAPGDRALEHALESASDSSSPHGA